jgi:hypothetical protein
MVGLGGHHDRTTEARGIAWVASNTQRVSYDSEWIGRSDAVAISLLLRGIGRGTLVDFVIVATTLRTHTVIVIRIRRNIGQVRVRLIHDVTMLRVAVH